ncbi:peptidylprolyl isomerase [Thauera linaloolentis]|uniref:peptidylprolyl isomerase n=1 Tax=Thauera linaloolentis (strain DSM 12138 / JCM 21573 / CCUG 41526 / CIP 105981 / IAM 15112 / NBRC 102519 / 47Lol) TaxID=1123367 RepID=N6YUU3_THAL4|nr:peptidylprolyl isomerase [Thauera linaloolentis]ENO85888.1 PpiC-type peptidyl-prolyl cis-trans isomerase [Thauera linaloolentis 47Lol = DSM 12138]MCM8567635.1 peptidylprolyl isomerase [Thauera linaloolentis]
MKRFPSRLAIAMLAGFLAFPAAAASPVAKVNGVAIPAERAEAMLAEQRAQGAPDSPQLQDAVREELVRREILSQQASSQGLAKKAEVLTQMELAKQAILIRAYLQDFIQNNPVTDADVQKEYDAIKSRMGDKEYKPRHVLVETEDQAKAIIARLQSGTAFEEVAKESRDPGSKERGGDLGWSNPGMFVQPFSEAMVKLEKGKFTTTPVKSDFGYHVIQLDDVRTTQAPPLDEVKPQLQQRLQQQKVEKHVLDLRAKAKVE